jgi:hypothetical protein
MSMILLPAAAVLVLAVGVWYWPGESSAGRAYGMVDLPELLEQSCVHLKGTLFLPRTGGIAGTDRVEFPFECWVDLANGRTWQTYYHTAVTGAVQDYHVGYRVCDGTYLMTIAPDGVEFSRLDDFRRALTRKRAVTGLYDELLGGRRLLSAFTRVGVQAHGGTQFEIWEREFDEPLLNLSARVQCLLDPRGGEIGRLQFWVRGTGSSEWQLLQRIDVWERYATPPSDVFATTPPAGAVLKNTKETADLMTVFHTSGAGNGVAHAVHIAFRLPDGSLLVSWSSRDLESTASQAPLFSELSFGGPLPVLPMTITGLLQVHGGQQIKYAGKHVAWTRKGEEFCEWSLYVPDREPPPAWKSYYRVEQEFNLPDNRVPPSIVANVSDSVGIDTPAEFRELVLGAMAEASDTRQPPADVTYERVLQLAQESRPVQP